MIGDFESDIDRELDAAGAPPDPDAPCDGVRLAALGQVRPKPVRWLWPGWLPRGKLAILAGAPGTGKTTVALGIAATVSTGGMWPDGSAARPGAVIVWSGEDDIADTLAPRLRAAGADLSRVHLVVGMVERGRHRRFDPAEDLPHLANAARTLPGGVALIVIDSIASVTGGADSHKNSETRRALEPLVDLGQELDCAILGISHFTKGTSGRDPVERVTGSLAFGALARVVWTTARRQEDQPAEDGTRRLLARAKSNLGPDGGGIGYDLRPACHDGIEAMAVAWGRPIEGSARDLLAAAEGSGGDGPGRPANELRAATDWLRAALADGPALVRDVEDEAAAAGHSERTMRRARESLGVVVYREGEGRARPWFLRLPDRGEGIGGQYPLHNNFGRLFPIGENLGKPGLSGQPEGGGQLDGQNSGVREAGEDDAPAGHCSPDPEGAFERGVI